MNNLNTENLRTQNGPLDQFFLERGQKGFIPLLKAQTDHEVKQALAAGTYLNADERSTTLDFYEMLSRVTAAFSPGRSDSSNTTLHDSWGHLILSKFKGSLGIEDYNTVVEATKKTADYLVEHNIYSNALSPVRAWLEKHIPIMPMLEDAKKRHNLLNETPKIVGGLPYYLIHSNNRKNSNSLIYRIFEEQDNLFRNGVFTKKIDSRAVELAFHQYSYGHIETMAANFVSTVDEESRQNRFDRDTYTMINSVTGLELRDAVREMLKKIQQRNNKNQSLDRIRKLILYRDPDDKPHPDDYPPALTNAYRSMIQELEAEVKDINYMSGITEAETWLTQASSITTSN